MDLNRLLILALIGFLLFIFQVRFLKPNLAHKVFFLKKCKLYDACNIGKCSAGTFHLTGVIWVCSISIVSAMQMSAVVNDNGHF